MKKLTAFIISFLLITSTLLFAQNEFEGIVKYEMKQGDMEKSPYLFG